MQRRIFSLIAVCLLIVALMSGCGPKAEPTETTPPPIGTVAGIPEQTPTPTPTPGITITNPPAPTPNPAPEPEPIPSPTPTATPVPPSQSTPLTILSIIGGDILIMSAGTDSWHQATIGTTLQPGDTIKAGSSSKAEITFFEGSTIELEASAEIRVSEIGVKDTGSTTIRLTQLLGKTISRVKKLTDSASRYEIETPAAIAAVRGSTMVVTVDINGTTVVANESGDIRVIVDGKEYIIHEGMKRTIIPGQPPSPEVPINPPPSEEQGGGGSGGGNTIVRKAKMEVTMNATMEAYVGDVITYTYYLHNTGDLPFHNISVSNNVAGNATYQSGDVNTNSILNPNETWVFTSTYTVGEGDPSSLVATATISGITSTSITIVDTETAITSILPEESIPGIALDKSADKQQVHVGDNITYTYKVTNTGNTPLSNITVTDDRLGSIPFGSDEDSILDVEETWTFTANYTVGSEDPSPLVNTANVSGTDNLEQIVTASDNASVTILRPGIALDKTVDPDIVHVGDNITYTYTVTNRGNTPLSDITVTDNPLGSIPFPSGINEESILDIEETWVFTANYTVGNDDPDLLENTATVSGMDNLSFSVIAEDSASVAILRPSITLEKIAEPLEVYVGQNITYTYTVTNTGNTPLSGITVTDDRLGCIPFPSGINEESILNIGETWTFHATHKAGRCDPSTLVNIAEVSGWDDLEQEVTATDSASVTICHC